ncbi:hypothetical protein POX_d05425 [Penicillium oxalicum]|uniref:hypothetical protein n=1 Tax=Penicillium oxalicum TaxID=69781 RepID=UPI0020B7E2AD|nr:hypothetical protein POX_d05425 [Penicillium oxalicum]KAI2789925.1 hypothetical protein POX_d05425 [Penicillium oxalicum]
MDNQFRHQESLNPNSKQRLLVHPINIYNFTPFSTVAQPKRAGLPGSYSIALKPLQDKMCSSTMYPTGTRTPGQYAWSHESNGSNERVLVLQLSSSFESHPDQDRAWTIHLRFYAMDTFLPADRTTAGVGSIQRPNGHATEKPRRPGHAPQAPPRHI